MMMPNKLSQLNTNATVIFNYCFFVYYLEKWINLVWTVEKASIFKYSKKERQRKVWTYNETKKTRSDYIN